MVYEKVIEGHFVNLRSITLDDAEFSYNLRKDLRFINIMGQAATTLEGQKNYIERQMKQPGDYYFVVSNKNGERIGLIGVYGIHDGVCEIGREINIGEPYESIEAEILLNDFAINVLKLRTKTYVIYKHNKKQIALQRSFGFEPSREVVRSGISSYEYELPFSVVNENYDRARKMIEQLAKKRGTK